MDAELLKVHERAAADILNDRQIIFFAERDHVLERHRLGKAHDAVVARVDLQKRARLLADGALVVVQVGLVRRAHLAQRAAALHHDLRDAERAADLDELPARGHDLAAAADLR